MPVGGRQTEIGAQVFLIIRRDQLLLQWLKAESNDSFVLTEGFEIKVTLVQTPVGRKTEIPIPLEKFIPQKGCFILIEDNDQTW